MGPQAKRRKVAAVEEVNFDHDARSEFLTGFRKRKQQRIKHAQETAMRKAREIKIEERKRMREERAAEFQQALKEHQKQLKRLNNEDTDSDGSGSDSDDKDEGDDEWEGFAEPPAIDYEAEYIDEDKYTTVTVEEMDASREGLLKYEDDSDKDQQKTWKSETDAQSKQAADKQKKKPAKPKKKKKKQFRYESKEDRKIARTKERLSKRRKADARRDRS